LEYLPQNLGLRAVEGFRARAGYHPDLVPDFDSARPFSLTQIIADNSISIYSGSCITVAFFQLRRLFIFH
jgi:hypothetical protein